MGGVGAAVGPQGVPGRDVAVVDAGLVKMGEACGDVAGQLDRVFWGEEVRVDHFTNVETLDKLEDDERRAATWKQVGVDHLHDVRVFGGTKECAVLFLEAIERAVAIPKDELQRA
mgnify:CR=1 FL=1